MADYKEEQKQEETADQHKPCEKFPDGFPHRGLLEVKSVRHKCD